MKPKILFVNHASVLGGGELSLLDLATHYRDTSEVVLFSEGPLRQKLEENGVAVSLLSASSSLLNVKTTSYLSTFKAIPNLLNLAQQICVIAQSGFDIIHVNSQKALVVVALAAMLGKLPPIVWHLRDILTAEHYSKINRWVAIALANTCVQKVIANSQATAQAFVQAGGKAALVQVVYNGIATENFDRPNIQKCAEIRQALGIHNAPTIGVFSRLSFWKGQHVVLQALKELPDVHLLLVGEALFGEVDYVNYLRSLTAELNLSDRVHWLGFRQDIPTLMQTCNYIIHPSTQPEPFGRVIVEGLLARKPVIGSAAGGALEILQEGITGRLFPPNDPHRLAGVIKELQTHPTQAQAIAHQGHVWAKEAFSLTTLFENFDVQMRQSLMNSHLAP